MKNKTEFLIGHLEEDAAKLVIPTIDDASGYIFIVKIYSNKLSEIDKLKNILGNKVSYETLWNNVGITISNYTNNIIGIDTKIVGFRNFIDLMDFDKLHAIMQDHCLNFSSLYDALKEIPDFPADFMDKHMKLVTNKILNIYDQIISIEWTDQSHIKPDNLKSYLQIINVYSSDQLGYFLEKFFECCSNPKCKNLALYEKGLIDIISTYRYYLYRGNTKKYLYLLLANKINLMAEKPADEFFYYLLKMKKLIKSKKSMIQINSILDVFYEIVNKHISLVMGTNSFTNIYRQDIDNSKIHLIIKGYNPAKKINLDFEKKILCL